MSIMSCLFIASSIIAVVFFCLWVVETQNNVSLLKELREVKHALYKNNRTDAPTHELQFILWEYAGLYKALYSCNEVLSALPAPPSTEDRNRNETYDHALRIKRFLQRMYLVSARPSTAMAYAHLKDTLSDYRAFDPDGFYLPAASRKRVNEGGF